MATYYEDIGVSVPTKVPQLGSDSHIGDALRAYHYGSLANKDLPIDPDNTGASGLAGHIGYALAEISSLASQSLGKSIFTAKGSLISSSASGAPSEFPKGATGHVLSSTATDIAWIDLSSTYYPLVGGKTVTGTFGVQGDTTIGGYLSANGGMSLYKSAQSTYLSINADAGESNIIQMRSDKKTRFILYKDAGDNFEIRAYEDDGSTHAPVMRINRLSGLTTFYKDVLMSATLDVTGNITASGDITGLTNVQTSALDVNGNADISGTLTGLDAITTVGLTVTGNADISGNLTGVDTATIGALNTTGPNVINGTTSFANAVAFNGTISVPVPTFSTNAATKQYVDDEAIQVTQGTSSTPVAGPKGPRVGDIYCKYL